MLRTADVVNEIRDHQRARLPVEEHALLQSEPVDAPLIDDAGKGRLRSHVVDSIDAQVGALPGQTPRRVQPRRREGGSPFADSEVMVQVRCIEMRHEPGGFDGGAVSTQTPSANGVSGPSSMTMLEILGEWWRITWTSGASAPFAWRAASFKR